MSNLFKKTVRLSMLVVLLGIGTCLSAQDMIVFSNGSIEQVKILKVGDNEIEYKKWTNQDGPTFSTSKTKIFSIKYQDGTEEKIETQVAAYSGDQRQVQAQKQTQGSHSQSSDGGFSIHLGTAFPLGDFKEDIYLIGDGRSGASTGFNIGIKGKIPLQVDGLGIFISGDFIFNPYNGLDLYNALDVKPKYINVPLLVGLNYKYSFSPMFGMWCEGGLGANFRKVSAIKYGNREYVFDLLTSFAGQVGGGVMIKDFFSIGLHYYGLGATEAKGEYIYTYYNDSYTQSFSFPKKYTQNCLVLRLGLHF